VDASRRGYFIDLHKILCMQVHDAIHDDVMRIHDIILLLDNSKSQIQALCRMIRWCLETKLMPRASSNDAYIQLLANDDQKGCKC